MRSFDAALSRFVAWMREGALPLWAARAQDPARGGFYESLDFSGAPIEDAARRARVQARQIHVFSTAARLNWHAGAERLARTGFDYFLSRACPDEGARGCVHILARDGAVIDARRDLYDQAFLLLACAAMWRSFAERKALDLAARTIEFLDREFAAPAGGYFEDDRQSALRRQNPHMHLFEAFMALGEATGDKGWRRRADDMVALFERRFFDARRGALLEFFDTAWNPDPQQGDVIEPGHMMEWVCLLARYEALGGKALTEAPEALFHNAVRLGADGSGFLVDAARIGGRAGGARRLWPQTEYLKACLVRARLGDAGAAARGAALIERLFETYLAEPVKGLWCDRYEEGGARIAADVPASVLYHLFDAAVEAQLYLEDRP